MDNFATRRGADPPNRSSRERAADSGSEPFAPSHRGGEAVEEGREEIEPSWDVTVNVVNAGTPQQVALSRPSPVPARTAVPANGPGASPSPQPGVLKSQPVQRDICTGEGAPESFPSRCQLLVVRPDSHFPQLISVVSGDISQVSTSEPESSEPPSPTLLAQFQVIIHRSRQTRLSMNDHRPTQVARTGRPHASPSAAWVCIAPEGAP